jgi:hypothetical protein
MKLAFLKTPLGITLISGAIVVVLLAGVVLFGGGRGKTKVTEKKIAGQEWKKSDNQRFDTPSPAAAATKDGQSKAAPQPVAAAPQGAQVPTQQATAKAQRNATGQQAKQKLPTSLQVYSTPKKANSEAELETMLAKKKIVPYGRLIKCVLINAAESINLESPVIGLTTEPLVWDGKVVIPASSEVHGMVKGAQQRDRLGCDRNWVVVLSEPKYRNRRELMLQSIVLDRDAAPSEDQWGVTYGSAGLKGMIIESADSKEFKLFMAAFISGMGNGLQDTTTTGFGQTNVLPSAKNAALGGVSNVIDEYANKIREAIQRDGVFVRVPAGKEFYLYVQQPIDLDEAKIGNTTIQQFKKSNSSGIRK